MEATRTHRFAALDSLRGVCACMIVLLHFETVGHISRSALVQNAFLFVDFFFVLSGFVIAASYGEKLAVGYSPGKFILLRLGRIYPLHFLMLTVFVAFEFATMNLQRPSGGLPFSEGFSVSMLLANLSLMQTFVGPDGLSWNGPSWSIAVEVWTYIVFAFAFRYFGRFIVPVSLALAIGCGLYLLTVTDRYISVFHDGALARCVIGFSFGVLAFHCYENTKIALSLSVATVLEIAAVAGTIITVMTAGAGPISLCVPILFTGVVLIFSFQSGFVSKLLHLRLFSFLGQISYSIYMVHMFIVLRTYNVLEMLQNAIDYKGLVNDSAGGKLAGPTPLAGDVMSIGVLAVSIGLAAITYRIIERPSNNWVRHKIKRREHSLAFA